MALNVLGEETVTSDFTSGSLADIGSGVTITVAKTTKVYIFGTALAVRGEQVSAGPAYFGYSVGGVDKSGVYGQLVVYSDAGVVSVPASFCRIETLAPGSHSIKLRGQTPNDGIAGSHAILQPMTLVVLG